MTDFNLQTLIDYVNSEGYIINNLFQIEEGWQANLKNPDRNTEKDVYHEFGKGPTAKDALFVALEKAIER